ncbi:hypothetical protein [Pseudomonas jilinensis]|uniref:Uncharacterized protein n=1 Tax=Pseudomonas jilinensis TaxID=2078689 RepID=A0A396RZ22_9PSED|nr:hypothetical protein [Pseudomonas jilinensis]RHW21900.1 hypothetical protein C2846_05405 [Pseudomonas jilinensis]
MDAQETLQTAKQFLENESLEQAFSAYTRLLSSHAPSHKLQGLMGQQSVLDADYNPYSALGTVASVVLCLGILGAVVMGFWGVSLLDTRGGSWALAWPVLTQGAYALFAGILGYLVLSYASNGLKHLLELRIAARVSTLLALRDLQKQA